MFLSRDELMDLSERKQRSGVASWLTQNGYKFDVAADGWPKVLRAAVEARLMPTDKRRTIKKSQPDFSAYEPTKKAA